MIKILTNEIARKNIGKYIDCYKRKFGYYPMKIIEINGEMFVKDMAGVCMPIEDNGFNARHFDYIFKIEQEEKQRCVNIFTGRRGLTLKSGCVGCHMQNI